MALFKQHCIVLLFLLLITICRAAEWNGIPVVIHLSDAVSPGKTFTINGFGFTDEPGLQIALYKADGKPAAAAPPANSLRPVIIQRDRNGNFMVSILPAHAAAGVYNVWVGNRDGWSRPIQLNAARPLFMSEREVYAGLNIKVSGRNLDAKEFGAGNRKAKTKMRLTGNGRNFEPLLTSCNPYCVSFKINNEPPGIYKIQISNDNGNSWGLLDNGQKLTILKKPAGQPASYDPLAMGVAWASHFNWNNIHRVPPSNGEKELTAAIQAIVDKTGSEAGGGIVYFPDGIYKIALLKLPEYVVLKGQSETGTVLSYCGHDKDFITCAGTAVYKGHVGIANLSIVAPAAKKQRPDVFINLGQAAIWEGVENISRRTATEMFLVNVRINYDFAETDKSRRGLPVSSIGKERLYVAGCDFKGFRMESHNYVSDYVTVKNNTFEFGQGVFIYTGNFLFLENNTITGHTEINREKHGFMLRANAYVYHNTVSHTGSDEDPFNENWNDGEALCNETPGGNHNFGAVARAGNKSLVAGKTAGPFTLPLVEIYNHRSVTIVHGRGFGQTRRVTGIDTATSTMMIEKEWNVVPDSTSRFTLMEPNENTVYYRNTIIDNPKGIWLFGNSIDCLAAENTSIDCDGIFIFSCMYTNEENPMYYFVPNYYNRITGNHIRGLSRKSHRSGLGLNSTREGSSKGAYFGVMDYANEFRNNDIAGNAFAIPRAGVTEAPAVSGIFIYATIHSSMYDGKNIAGDATNHIIEDNQLASLATGIDLSRCIYGQIIRNNHMAPSVRLPVKDTMGSQNTVYIAKDLQ